MKKFVLLLFLSTSCWANPKAIHYSSLGNYLVNENGQRTTITGHPRIICYRPENHTLEGTFQKAKGSTIWIIADKWDGRGLDNWHVEIPNPVCDLK